MAKIKVKNPVVEIDGDEMTRIIWQWIRERLILPYLDVELEYYDLVGREPRRHRRPGDRSTAARAIQKHGVGVKCATITPDEARVEEFKSQEDVEARRTARSATSWAAWSSASRSSSSNVPRLIPGWTDPIVVGRHAFGDQYRATDFKVPGPGTLTPRSSSATDGEVIDRMRCFEYPGARRRHGHVQPRRIDPRFRAVPASTMALDARLAGVSVDQEHDPQGL